MINKILVFSLTCLLEFIAYSQSINVHPRVLELENKIHNDASELIKTRFPNMPFLITIKIEPLRRTISGNTNNIYESLPFLSIADPIIDEWDDPNKTLNELFLRVKSIRININLPDKISDTDILELKELLFASLNLIPGRDKIECIRKPWKLIYENENKIWKQEYYVLIPTAFIILLIFFAIFKHLANSIIYSLKSLPQQSATTNINPINSQSLNLNKGSNSTTLEGDIKFNDPLKIKEHFAETVNILEKDQSFPNLEDMIKLDTIAEQNPDMLGAIVKEFSLGMQKKLFSYSNHTNWMQGLIEPGTLNIKSLEIIIRLSKNRIKIDNYKWEEILILCWRLNADLIIFLHDIPENEAKNILKALPSNISIPYGKKVFPGSWGELLNIDKDIYIPDESTIEKYKQKILNIRPLNNYDTLTKYKHQKELLKYLRIADINEEQDIYTASGEDSIIHKIRPPFYKVFEKQEPDILKKLVSQFSIQEWAYALFNTPRDLRRNIEYLFTDKQKFLLIETFKTLDKQNINKEEIGIIRELIAQKLYMLSKEVQINHNLKESEKSNQDNSNITNNNNETYNVKEDNINAAA